MIKVKSTELGFEHPNTGLLVAVLTYSAILLRPTALNKEIAGCKNACKRFRVLPFCTRTRMRDFRTLETNFVPCRTTVLGVLSQKTFALIKNMCHISVHMVHTYTYVYLIYKRLVSMHVLETKTGRKACCGRYIIK